MEQDSQTPETKSCQHVLLFITLKKKKKKTFTDVLEQSRQNIEMRLVKKTMNREY